MTRNYTTKEVLDFARKVAKESIKDDTVYGISIDFITLNVISRALREMKKIARFTLIDFKLNVKSIEDVKIVVIMNDILLRAKTEIKTRG